MEHYNCYTPQCPRREVCTLWHNALQAIEQKPLQLSITNPRLIEEAGGYEHCPLFHEYKLRSFARGLVWRYREMTVSQLEEIQQALNQHFGYSKMVRLRCGYEAIDPEEQAVIANIFAQIVPDVSPRYKRFEEHYTKPPRVEGRAAHKYLK